MKAGSTVESGIHLRWDRLQEFMGELSLLSVEGQARQLEMRPLNLHRAKHDNRVGDRTIVEIMAGTAAIARRRRAKAPKFEDLFEIRLPARPES
ncbi:hypothetical protein [Dactylosporangium sp. CA-139066]|uniref:hypothetical protein n=1 Tax=Dactylosporangium sp. CA-139066 TaxID=3239930 RepID=UPI003D8B4D3D